MSFKGKPVIVKITGDAKLEYEMLTKLVNEETSKGITHSEKQTLLKSILQKIDLLKSNPEYGTPIQKNKIPKEYQRKYEVNNLWKVNLSKAWRMIYTIRGNQIEIIALILDILDHKNYGKKMGYKRN